MKTRRKTVWMILFAVLLVAAVSLIIYVVVRTLQSDRSMARITEIQNIAHGSDASSGSVDTETVPSPLSSDPPESGSTGKPEESTGSESVPADTTSEAIPATSETVVSSVLPTTELPETTAVPVTTPPVTTEAPIQTTTAVPNTTEPPASGGDYPSEISWKINFSELRKTNGDIYAWIVVPGTSIDYPILRREGDDPDHPYYLKHDIDGETDGTAAHSALFTEDCNSLDFTDFLTVIYGHAMRDGTMFADLLQYRDQTYFEQHPWIIVYTESKTLLYRVCAAYKFDDRHLVRNYDWSSTITRMSYFPWVRSEFRDMNSNFADVTVGPSDRILTLSCCTFVEGNRYLVQGLLVEER